MPRVACLSHCYCSVPWYGLYIPRYLSINCLSARQLSLSYRDITWEAELRLCLRPGLPVALYLAYWMTCSSIHCSLLLPGPSSISPQTTNITKDVTRLLDSAVHAVVVATNYHSWGRKTVEVSIQSA